MACGPVAGNTIAEIECEDQNGETYFVHISRCGTYPTEYVVISKDSGIDDAVNQEWDNIMLYKESPNNTVFEYDIGNILKIFLNPDSLMLSDLLRWL